MTTKTTKSRRALPTGAELAEELMRDEDAARLFDGVRAGRAADVIQFLERFRERNGGRLRNMTIEFPGGVVAEITWRREDGDGKRA